MTERREGSESRRDGMAVPQGGRAPTASAPGSEPRPAPPGPTDRQPPTPQPVPTQRVGRVFGYPAERPDFEPPPPWARPGPGTPRPPDRPFGTGPAGSQPPVEGRDRSWRPPKRSVLVVLGLTIALVAAAIGASAGVFATLKFGPALLDTANPPNEDDL